MVENSCWLINNEHFILVAVVVGGDVFQSEIMQWYFNQVNRSRAEEGHKVIISLQFHYQNILYILETKIAP